MDCGSTNIDPTEVALQEGYKPKKTEVKHICSGILIIVYGGTESWSQRTEIKYNSKGEIIN